MDMAQRLGGIKQDVGAGHEVAWVRAAIEEALEQ